MFPLGKQAFAYQQDVTVSGEAHDLLWEPGILLRGCERHLDAFPFFRREFPGDHARCKVLYCNELRR
jgi:hypothetical protein